MEYEEYMESLMEQVHDKRAKRLIAEWKSQHSYEWHLYWSDFVRVPE